MKIKTLTAEQERAQIKHAYSYIRLSSKKQTGSEKSGTERQADAFKPLCERYGWIPQEESFADLGVSAFSGANFDGKLGEFMRLAQEGKLAPFPVLVIEAFDRFSRQDIDESEPAVMALLKAGVAIHVKFSGQTFTRASTVELGDRITIMVALKSAYKYSQDLSERVTAAKHRKLDRLAKGENVNIRDYAPRWIGWNAEAKKMILNDNAEAVRIIFKEYQTGKSLTNICRVLNTQKIKTFLGGDWTKQTVRKILSNPACYGAFKGSENVFPAVVSKEQFEAVQLILERNSGAKLQKGEKAKQGQTFGRRGRSAKTVNIFRGLVRCDCCGHAMSLHTGRTNKYYRCDKVDVKLCNNRLTARTDKVELTILGSMLEATPEDLLAANDKSISHQIAQLELKRDSITKKITALLELAGIVGTDEIKKQMIPLKADKDKIEAEISTLQKQANLASKSPEAFNKFRQMMAGENGIPGILYDLTDKESAVKAIEMLKEQLANEKTRQELANIMPSLIKFIRIEGHYLTTHFVAGGTDSGAFHLD